MSSTVYLIDTHISMLRVTLAARVLYLFFHFFDFILFLNLRSVVVTVRDAYWLALIFVSWA